MQRHHSILTLLAAGAAVAAIACAGGEQKSGADAQGAAGTGAAGASNGAVAASDSGARAAGSTAAAPSGPVGPTTDLAPNELGRIPVLEYHLIGDRESAWMVERQHFRRQLQMLYDRGFRPVTMKQVLDKKIDLPRGTSPVVFTFDDASQQQFSYIERNGQLEIDPNSVVGIWLAFRRQHPQWTNSAVFCTLNGGAAGHNFFGDKGIDGQKTEWRHQKVKFLADSGFELCNHTLWHAQLSKYPDAFVQEQIMRGQMGIDSAVPGYQVRTFCLPQGLWPKNRQLAWQGSWTDPKSGRTHSYRYDAVLEVSGGPARSPHDPQFNGHSIPRIIVVNNDMERVIDRLDRERSRYVSDGDPSTVARPAAQQAAQPAAQPAPAAQPSAQPAAPARP
jgi:peptidoglycan/xylan/chitin deacetylase (PgdA/CDA1 family)